MSSSATTIATLKTAVAAVLGTITDLKVYKYEPRELDSRPAVTMQTTRVARAGSFRGGLDDGEDELGRFDFTHTFTLRLYVDYDDGEKAESDADALLGQIIGAFDNDPGLGGTSGVFDTKVLSADYGELMRDSKPMLGYVMELGIRQGIT